MTSHCVDRSLSKVERHAAELNEAAATTTRLVAMYQRIHHVTGKHRDDSEDEFYRGPMTYQPDSRARKERCGGNSPWSDTRGEKDDRGGSVGSDPDEDAVSVGGFPSGRRTERPGISAGAGAGATLSPRSREYVRLRVNARERQRMHDMNSALDALRGAMPYAQGPAVKKLSKMNTLLLARNYISLLTRTLDDLRRLLAEVHTRQSLPWSPRLDAAMRNQELYAQQQQFTEELVRREQLQLLQLQQAAAAEKMTLVRAMEGRSEGEEGSRGGQEETRERGGTRELLRRGREYGVEGEGDEAGKDNVQERLTSSLSSPSPPFPGKTTGTRDKGRRLGGRRESVQPYPDVIGCLTITSGSADTYKKVAASPSSEAGGPIYRNGRLSNRGHHLKLPHSHSPSNPHASQTPSLSPLDSQHFITSSLTDDRHIMLASKQLVEGQLLETFRRASAPPCPCRRCFESDGVTTYMGMVQPPSVLLQAPLDFTARAAAFAGML